jgi:hypothetical protein
VIGSWCSKANALTHNFLKKKKKKKKKAKPLTFVRFTCPFNFKITFTNLKRSNLNYIIIIILIESPCSRGIFQGDVPVVVKKLSKTAIKLRTVGLRAKIQNECLLNISLQGYHYTNLLGVWCCNRPTISSISSPKECLQTNSIKQSPCWEVHSHSASQEILLHSWNAKVHYRVNKGPPLDLILSQTNADHTQPSC